MQNTSLPIVNQIQIALAPVNRLGSIIGFLLGSIVPLMVFVVSHEIPKIYLERNWGGFALLTFIALGGCAVSFKSVYSWCALAFHGDRFKAAGFVTLIEGAMLASGMIHDIAWIGWIALVALMSINAISAACSIACQSKEYRKTNRRVIVKSKKK